MDKYIFSERLIIIGAGGHSKVVNDIAALIGFEDIAYLDNKSINTALDKNVYSHLKENFSQYFFVAIGDNYIREKVFNEFLSDNPNATPISLLHPSAVISETVSVGKGSLIMPLCVVNSQSVIGNGVIVNTSSSIDHESTIMNFSSLAPGVNMGGNVSIGSRTALCIGCTVSHGISIGNDVVIGASSLVLNDIRDNTLAYGIPAKIIKTRFSGEKYFN
ncbi:acetyltransferase [Prochlorococcus sp. MIT 1307]|uniref:acetyltransferase n=1 Tax=Prochlorococcus sp. MIT 1307 TaxID=3096219 RepID=UPI002A747D3E|nr:acetyltransferase [Prochlorococcus sp. MIT 1307]